MKEHPDLTRWDEASGTVRDDLLTHLRSCGQCRATWVAEEPSRVFALLRDVPVPAAVLDDVTRGARGALAPSVRTRAFSRPALPRVAACAAALLLTLATARLLTSPRKLPPEIVKAPAAHADVELLSSPGDAKLVDLTVGDTQVVMIFDEGLDL